jgi:hypothetical protein
VYGSFHGCVDFLLVARVIFMSFSRFCHARLVPSILRCLGSDLFVGIMDRCLVHLYDPSISEFGLRLKDFGWNPSFFVELGCDSIPGDLVRLRTQVWGIASPRMLHISPKSFLKSSSCLGDPWMDRRG